MAALQARVSDLESELAAERARAAESLSRQAATAEILRIISSSPTDLEPVAQAIVDSAFRLCGCAFAAVFRFDGELIHWVAARGTSVEQEDGLRSVWPRPPDRATLTGRTILARETLHVHDITLDPDYGVATPPGARQALAIRTFLGVPLFRDGRLIGTINLHRSEVRPFSAQEVTLVQTFADQAVIAIENVRLFTELQERNEALTEAQKKKKKAHRDLRRPGCHRLENVRLFNELRARNPRAHRGAGAADGDERHPPRDQPVPDRRAARVRRDRRKTPCVCAARCYGFVVRLDGRADTLRRAPPSTTPAAAPVAATSPMRSSPT